MTDILGISPSHATSFEPVYFAPKTLTQVPDTFEVVNSDVGSFYSPSKPELASPKCLEMMLLATLDKLHAQGTSMLNLEMKSMEILEGKVKELHMQNMEKMQEIAKKSQQSGFWSFLQKIGFYILSAFSFVFGFSLSATGAGSVIGGVMMATALLNIVNLALSEANAWIWIADQIAGDNEERRNLLSSILPLTLGWTCGVVGLVGSINAAVWSSLDLLQKTLAAAKMGLSAAEGATTIGSGVTGHELSLSEAELISLKELVFLNEHRLESTVTLMERVMKKLDHVSSSAAKSIQVTIQSNKRAITQV